MWANLDIGEFCSPVRLKVGEFKRSGIWTSASFAHGKFGRRGRVLTWARF